MSECSAPRGPIAIDGPAASGKSAVGQALASALGFAFLDTGLMYRAFALAALRNGLDAVDEAACTALAERLPLRALPGEDTAILLGAEDVTAELRTPRVEQSVSLYSAIGGVRAAMVTQQRQLAADGKCILAGRDIGTVVLPEAPVKLFLTASEEARARRRGLQNGGAAATAAAQEDISNRDRRDSGRAVSPLRAADDAIVIDTTHLTLNEVIGLALEHVRCAKD